MLKKIIVISLMVWFIAASGAYAAGVEIAIGGWRQSLSGNLSYQALSDNDILDLETDMQFDDEDRVLGRIKIDLPAFLPNIYLVGAPMEFEGTGRKSVAFTYGDTTFNASADLTTKIKVNQYDVGLYYGLPFISEATAGKFNVDIGLNVRVVDLEASITGLSGATTVEESESFTLPVPMLYLAVQFTPIESLAFEVEGRGISIGDSKLYSLTGRVRYQFAGPVFVAGGYRFDKLDVDEEDVVADVEFKGPFVELGLKF